MPQALQRMPRRHKRLFIHGLHLFRPRTFRPFQELFIPIKNAHTNRNGKLLDNELVFLSPTEQQVWKLRVEKFGYIIE